MSHLNYNHLYYFWMVCKQGSVKKAADTLFLTPQTITGQIKALEARMDSKLLKRNGRHVEPTELGQLIYKYADRMFGLSYEMLDIVNYSQRANILFDVGVSDAISKHIVSQILLQAVPKNEHIHLRCFESTHELLLEQLSQHKLDMILSDCPVDSTRNSGLFSKKLGESQMSFFSFSPPSSACLLDVLQSQRVLIPGSRTVMGRNVLQWFDSQGIQADIMGEFDDVALMKSFARSYEETIFLAPFSYTAESDYDAAMHYLGSIADLKEQYYIIFAERMIQHPAVKRICDADFSDLFVCPDDTNNMP
jgi:LysR family transcriptional activator of nhaA